MRTKGHYDEEEKRNVSWRHEGIIRSISGILSPSHGVFMTDKSVPTTTWNPSVPLAQISTVLPWPLETGDDQ